VITETDKAALEEIAVLADRAKLIPRVGKVFPLSEAATAHALMDDRNISGKIILKVN